MADVTGKELKAAREASGLYQYQAAHLMSVSEDVIGRWERGEVAPGPDDVDRLEKLYKAPGLWYGWMRYQYRSFRERFPEDPENAALALAMVTAQYELEDVQALQAAAIKDALDGRIDNPKAFAAYIDKVKRAHTTLGLMLAKAESEGV